jgi:hypothetical protein
MPLSFENNREETFDIIFSDGSKTVIVSLTTNSELLILLLSEKKKKGGMRTLTIPIMQDVTGSNFSVYEYIRSILLRDEFKVTFESLLLSNIESTISNFTPTSVNIVSARRRSDNKERTILRFDQNNQEIYHITFWEYIIGDASAIPAFPLNASTKKPDGHSHLRDPFIQTNLRNLRNNNTSHFIDRQSIIGFKWSINFDGEHFFLSFDTLNMHENEILRNNPYVSAIIKTLQTVLRLWNIPCHVLSGPNSGGLAKRILIEYLTNRNIQASDIEYFLTRCNLRINDFPANLR